MPSSRPIKNKPVRKVSSSPAVRSGGIGTLLSSRPKFSKKVILIAAALVAGIGAYFMFFAGAEPNYCQVEDGANICHVNLVYQAYDSVLSVDGEYKALGEQGWGEAYGAIFKAPTTPLDGAVPVYRLYNAKLTWHEWATADQKSQKEAKYNGNGDIQQEGVAFFAWTDGHRPGTVPVYRITSGGAKSKSIYSVDKTWIDQRLAEGATEPDGWRIDAVMPGIAFWAYPPNYQVKTPPNEQPKPDLYDCSLLENASRCTAQWANLNKSIANGMPVGPTCPNNLTDYQKAQPSQFDQACNDRWNAYMRDCSAPEIMNRPTCVAERQAKANENAKIIAAQAAVKANPNDPAAAAKAASSATAKPVNPTVAPKTTIAPPANDGGAALRRINAKNNGPPGFQNADNNSAPAQAAEKERTSAANERRVKAKNGAPGALNADSVSGRTSTTVSTGEINNGVVKAPEKRADCVISWKQDAGLYNALGGGGNRSTIYHNTTLSECNTYFTNQSMYVKRGFFEAEATNYHAKWDGKQIR